jgi:hypothetical protein
VNTISPKPLTRDTARDRLAGWMKEHHVEKLDPSSAMQAQKDLQLDSQDFERAQRDLADPQFPYERREPGPDLSPRPPGTPVSPGALSRTADWYADANGGNWKAQDVDPWKYLSMIITRDPRVAVQRSSATTESGDVPQIVPGASAPKLGDELRNLYSTRMSDWPSLAEQTQTAHSRNPALDLRNVQATLASHRVLAGIMNAEIQRPGAEDHVKTAVQTVEQVMHKPLFGGWRTVHANSPEDRAVGAALDKLTPGEFLIAARQIADAGINLNDLTVEQSSMVNHFTQPVVEKNREALMKAVFDEMGSRGYPTDGQLINYAKQDVGIAFDDAITPGRLS